MTISLERKDVAFECVEGTVFRLPPISHPL